MRVEGHCVVLRGHRAEQLACSGRGQEALTVRAELAACRPDGLLSERAQALEAESLAIAALGRCEKARARQAASIGRLRKALDTGHPPIHVAESVRSTLR